MTTTTTTTSTPIITTAIIPDEDVEQRKRVAAAHYRQGNHHYLAGDYSHAIESYTCALEHWPDDSSTWNNRGMSYIAKQLIRTGIRDYNQAIALSPNVADLYYKRGVAYSLLRHYPASIEDYTHCLQLHPQHCDALNNRGNALKQLGYLQQSHADLTSAHNLQPHNTMYTMNLKKIEIMIQQSLSSPDPSFDTASQRAHAIISHLQSLASQVDITPEQIQADATIANAIQKSKEKDEKQRYDGHETHDITSILKHKHARINGSIGKITEENEVPTRKRQRHITHEPSTSTTTPTIRPVRVFPSDDSYIPHSASLV